LPKQAAAPASPPSGDQQQAPPKNGHSNGKAPPSNGKGG
jgi:hypothetical protein